MTFSEQKKNKLYKYCYKMNKACVKKDINKVSNYFNHLKYHIMTGGSLTPGINDMVNHIEADINLINEKNNTFKIEFDSLSNKVKQLTDKQVELVNKNNKNEIDKKRYLEKIEILTNEKIKLMGET